MDHPNIAKVLDAGSTESGGPYFVMELVRGIPITEYCDQAKLTVRERLELFVQVCQAIQHSHQKGIIHRDVKPSNVLVTLHDSKPVPKVIDFGVAKATNQRLTERTIYTRFAQIIGTPMYMSPEQAALSGLDVDTRSDIYSLGMLLYELLTGTTPFDQERFDKAAYDEIRRIVREEQPSKPSTKISTLGDNATAVSAHRGTDPHSLSKFVRGDLDVIVMKAIEKDRTRRYDTASGLAADVDRFLRNEPIVARSPSLAYRFAKFARRNRVAMATSALVLTSLFTAVVVTSWMAAVARQAAQRAEGEFQRANETLRRLAVAAYREAVAAALDGDSDKAEAALEDARAAGASTYQIDVLKGLIALNRGEYDQAIKFGEQAMADDSQLQDPDRFGAHALLANAYFGAGYDDLYGLETSQLSRLQPRSDTDHLLMASAITCTDPAESLKVLNKAPRIQRLPIGLLIQAAANVNLGVETGNAELVDKAVRDFEYVQFLFRDSQYAKSWRIIALSEAAGLAENQGRHEAACRYLQQGRSLAEELEAVTNCPYTDGALWFFYQTNGDDERAFRAICRANKFPGSYSWFLAADCLRRYDGAAAVETFDKAIPPQHGKSKLVRLARAHFGRDLPGGAQEVRELVGDLLEDPILWLRYEALQALCLADSPDEIHKQARRAISGISQKSLHATNLMFLADDLDEPGLLEQAGKSAKSKSTAHFTIAMMRLAERNREEAHEHLRMSVATYLAGYYDYEWARAYLARMDADPNWPRWIQDKADK